VQEQLEGWPGCRASPCHFAVGQGLLSAAVLALQGYGRGHLGRDGDSGLRKVAARSVLFKAALS